MSDEAIIEAATLVSLTGRHETGYSNGALEELWLKCPGILDELPFMRDDAKSQAAKAYLYSSGRWLDRAEKVYPKVLELDAYLATALAADIVVIKQRVEFLQRLGYSASLDGVTGAAADLAKRIRDAMPSTPTLILGAGAAAAIAVLVLVLVLR